MKLKDVVNHAKTYDDGLLDTIDQSVLDICDEVHLMPDTHIGLTVPIGFVGKVKPNRIIPEMVGVDIGCGMSAIKIEKEHLPNLSKLHEVISQNIPTSHNIRQIALEDQFDFNELNIPLTNKQIDRFEKSLGTLGGGNHFIEVDEFDDFYLLVVHSGSRNLGHTICKYYTDTYLSLVFDEYGYNVNRSFIKYNYPKSEWETQFKIHTRDKYMRQEVYLQGRLYDEYVSDMLFAVEYGRCNRFSILHIILYKLNLTNVINYSDIIDVPHNYYDVETNILYKGAINASEGRDVIIPINMRDGVILGKGAGNDDWLCASPHGAGRIKSRLQAKRDLTVDDMLKQTKHVFSNTINQNTLDEHPDAYRAINEIRLLIQPTVKDAVIGKPVFNYKGN